MDNTLTQEIQNKIIEYQLKLFVKKNSQALSIIFKALIKGEKTFSKEKIKEKSHTKKDSKQKEKPLTKDEQIKKDNENLISPLNIEG